MTQLEETQASIAESERISIGDIIISALLFAATWVLLTIWEFSGISPAIWDDAVVASGVRPAVHVAQNFWTFLASFLYRGLGIDATDAILRLAGHAALALLSVGVYAILREVLAFVMRARPQLSKRRRLVMRTAAAVGSACFVCADPAWTAGLCCSESTLQLLLAFGAIECFFLLLRKGQIRYAYVSAILLGLLAAETPAGLILPAVLILANTLIMRYLPLFNSPFFKPAVIEVAKWHITFLFIFAFLLGLAVNCATFVQHQGIEALGETSSAIPLMYLSEYWGLVAGATTPVGWIAFLAIFILPFVVSIVRFPDAADEEKFLSYGSGLLYIACTVIAFSQSASLPAMWTWTYFPFNSQLLLLLGVLCSTVTVATGVTIMGMDSLCRNHARLAEDLFGAEPIDEMVDDESVELGADDRAAADLARRQMAESARRVSRARSTRLMRLVCVVIVPAVMLAMLLPGRQATTARLMLDIVQDTVDEIVDEMGDAKFVFTGGKLDTAIEMESAKRGKSATCLSLMGGGGKMGAYLRTRGMMDNEEDVFAFGRDTAMGLRTWIHDKPENLEKCAVMMGFDLWKRDGKDLPPMGGLLSLPGGFASEAEREASITNAVVLADRVLAIHERRGGVQSCSDESIREAFMAIQWRLARMCFYRSEVEDLAGNGDAAIANAMLSKKLNDANSTYKDLIEMFEKRNEMMMRNLTPREGLQLALVRADFNLAKLYSETILAVDPENPDANFAMGMNYLQQKQLTRAEYYLKRCLARRPNEPAIYNNLAMIQISRKKFDAAEQNIKKALELAPGAAAIKDTQVQLQKARANAGR